MTQQSLQVSSLAAGGDGIVAIDGATRFVPGAAPGDIAIFDSNGVLQKVEPGPEHAQARCTHFGVCGGCTLQHLKDEVYSAWLKTTILRKLEQHDLGTEIFDPILTPLKTRRRCTVSGRWQGGRFVIGFAQTKSHTLVALKDCAVLDPKLLALIEPLRALFEPYVKKRETLRLSMTLAANGVDMLVTGIEYDTAPFRQDIASFAHNNQAICRIVGQDAGYDDILFQLDTPMLALSGGRVALPYGAFTQATPHGEAAIIETLRSWIGTPKAVADLFCGIGTFSVAAAKYAKVDAYEASRPAVQALQTARLDKGRHGINAVHRDLFRRPLSITELKSYDTVILDPPRAGAKAQCETLAGSDCKQILYVSCNPNTFARDARMLVDGGYTLNALQPVGQFLWSTHVELAAQFTR